MSGGGPVRIARLDTAAADFGSRLRALKHWSDETDAAIEQAVAGILTDVRRRGDAAVLEYTARFDGLDAASMAELEIGAAERRQARA